MPWCSYCQLDVAVESNEADGFTCVQALSPSCTVRNCFCNACTQPQTPLPSLSVMHRDTASLSPAAPQVLHQVWAGSRRKCFLQRHDLHQGARGLQPGVGCTQFASLDRRRVMATQRPCLREAQKSSFTLRLLSSPVLVVARLANVACLLTTAAHRLAYSQVEGVFVSEAGLGRSAGPRGTRLYGQQAESQEKTINKGARALLMR